MKKPVKGYKDSSGKLVDEQDLVDKLTEIANRELGWWSGKTEKDEAGEKRIADEYIKLLYPRGLKLGDDEFDPKKDAWSALFIVYLVWQAAKDLDLATPPLTKTVRHILYAHKAYLSREADGAGSYWALPRTATPQVGDIVVKQRMSSAKVKKNGKTVTERFFRPRIQFRDLATKDWGETHGDLVTAAGSELTVVGGNVGDSVKASSYALKDGAIDSECLCGVAWPSSGNLSRADYRRYIEDTYGKTFCPHNSQCLVFTVLRLNPVAGYIGSSGSAHRHVLPALKVPDVDDKSVVSAVWRSEYARRGEIVNLAGRTAGIASGATAILTIYRHDPAGSHEVVEQLSGTVESDEVAAEWNFEYEGDVEELPDVNEGAEEYLPPRYFFELVAEGESARSGLLEFRDRMEIELLDKDGKAIPDLGYTARFADGSEASDVVDDQGKAELLDIPPGAVRLVFAGPQSGAGAGSGGSAGSSTGPAAPPTSGAAPPAPTPSAPGASVEEDWIEIEVGDEDGHILANREYVADLPDGSERRGRLDDQGKTRLEKVPSGEVRFGIIFELPAPDNSTDSVTTEAVRTGKSHSLTLDLITDILEEIEPSSPGELLADIDAAGKVAAGAFDHYVGRIQPGKDLYDLEEDLLETGLRVFIEAIEKQGAVPARVVDALRRSMPRGYGRFVPDGRDGHLSTALFVLEGHEKMKVDTGDEATPAKPDLFPLLAYLDDIGKQAADEAVKKYKSKLPAAILTQRPIPGLGSAIAPDLYRKATEAAREAFLEKFVSIPKDDIWDALQRAAERKWGPTATWTIIISALAGLLTPLVLAPRAVAERASALGLEGQLKYQKDFEVFKSGDGKVKLKLGGSVQLLPDGLAEGYLWEQTSEAFKAQAKTSISYGPLSISGKIGSDPKGLNYGVMVTLKLKDF